MGITKGGAFDITSTDVHDRCFSAPVNPNGRPNSDVVSPGSTARISPDNESRMWIIDFG